MRFSAEESAFLRQLGAPSFRAFCGRVGSRSQNSKYPPEFRRPFPSVPVAGNNPTTPRKFSHAASFSAESELTNSRIMSHAAKFNAPSGAGPMAKDTEHCGQKQIRCAADFCRGRMPTVWANMYTATDLCPGSISRLQRRQRRFSTRAFPVTHHYEYCVFSAGNKCASRFR
jgi:hypothetical protein